MERNELENRTWFTVTMLFRSSVGSSRDLRPLCEERLVLYQGENAELVEAVARKDGQRDAHSYANRYGEEVTWSFAGIEKVERIDQPIPGQGWSVSSRFVRKSIRTLERAEAHARLVV